MAYFLKKQTVSKQDAKFFIFVESFHNQLFKTWWVKTWQAEKRFSSFFNARFLNVVVVKLRRAMKLSIYIFWYILITPFLKKSISLISRTLVCSTATFERNFWPCRQCYKTFWKEIFFCQIIYSNSKTGYKNHKNKSLHTFNKC